VPVTFVVGVPLRGDSPGAFVFGEFKVAWREVHTLHCRGARRQSRRQSAKRKVQATYYKPIGRPHLILRERTRTDDHEMLDEAFRTAVAKARELGWIV
jgi:hypothetical protein